MNGEARVSTRSGLLLALVALGAALRIAYAWPPHKYPADANALLGGLQSLRILQGHPAALHPRSTKGALESYGHAAAIALSGVGRQATAVAPLLAGIGLIAVYGLLARSLLGAPLGNVALLFLALPAPAFLFWTYMPLATAEPLLFGTATLWLADRIRRGEERLAFPLGLSAGLALWCSVQSAAFLLPALFWLPWSDRSLARNRRFLVWAVCGLAMGSLPRLAHAVAGAPSPHPDSSPGVLLANAAYLMKYDVPELLASVDPENGPNPPGILQTSLRTVALALHAGGLLTALAATGAWWTRGRPRPAAPGVVLLLSVAVLTCFLKLSSSAADERGLTVAHVLPAYLLAPAGLALLLAGAWKKSRPATVLAALALLVFNVAGYALPGGVARRRWEAQAASDEQLRGYLERRDITAVVGDYWDVYPFNYLSALRIRGLPTDPSLDVFRYGETLPAAARWALTARSVPRLEQWASRAGLPISVEQVGDYAVAIPAELPPADAAAFLQRLRGASVIGP